MSLIKINYHQYVGDDYQSPFDVDGIGFEPELVVNNTPRSAVYYDCPAWKHKASRTFLIRSPVDIDFVVDTETNNISSPNLNQRQFDIFLGPTFNVNWCTPEKTTVQLTVPRFLFWTNEKNVWIEEKPHCKSAIKNNIIGVGAWFNLSSWTRPLSCAFDIVDTNKPVSIKRGDPLLEVSFYSKNLDAGVLLKKSSPPEKVLQRSYRNTMLKNYAEGLSKYFMFKDQKSKCPFHNLWK